MANDNHQLLSYAYDENGNVTHRGEDLTGIQETFTHDALNRLDSWAVAGFGLQSFSYDDIGNLLARRMDQGLGEDVTYQYGAAPAGPHAVTHSSYGDYTYNQKGNQLTGPGRTVHYTAFNLPKTISGGGTQLAFRYDASHRRVIKRNANGDQTLSIGDLYEKRTTQGQTMHVFYVRAGGSTIAQVQRVENGGVTTAESTQYLHSDNLGTVDTVTDESGSLVERRKYEPFGGRRNPLNPFERLPTLPPSDVRYGFTFQEHDNEFGLINMRGRIYEPDSAHFLTADPYVSHPFFGQSYNRYAYVLNNPTTLVDPSGFGDCPGGGPLCIGWSGGGGGFCIFGFCINFGGSGSSGGGSGNGGGGTPPPGGGGGPHPNCYPGNNLYQCKYRLAAHHRLPPSRAKPIGP